MLNKYFRLIFSIFLLITVRSSLCDENTDSSETDSVDSPSLPPLPSPSSSEEELIDYQTPDIPLDNVYLYEPFDDKDSFHKNWVTSKATKSDSEDGKYDGEWEIVPTVERIPGDLGLMMNSRARHHAIGAKFTKPFDFKGGNLVVQYDVQFRNGQECGGAYLKLLQAPSGDLSKIHDKTPYSIMFGPDKCGNEHKLHFIFNHRNKKNNSLREIHWKKASTVTGLNEAITDNKWHLFRLVVRPDNSYEISVDKKIVGKGSLLEDFNPPVNPPKEIDDPDDTKPEDWDEREKIPDPDAKKPDDWDENEPRKIVDSNAQKPSDWLEDEPEMIPDPEAKKPEDWSEEMDGEWEPPLINNPKCGSVSGCGPWKAPLIDNPKYKGKWKPPLISNPNYQGKWAPRKIPNPDYFEDLNPYKMIPFDGVAFELWTISDGIAFDNILITSDIDLANNVADHTYQLKKDINDEKTDNWFQSFIRSTNKKPWLWAVYILSLLVPIFMLMRVLSPKKKDSEGKKKSSENEQKFDASGDDISNVAGPSTSSSNRASPPTTRGASSSSPSSAQEQEFKEEMEVSTEEEEVEEDDDEEGEEGEREEIIIGQDNEEENDDEEEEEEEPEIEEKEVEEKGKARLRRARRE
ncbi:calnexin [Tetranychus urticae]|uniref:Calnexin n=1 Tax=Tetranychus urticae TaxID=32264 RepID=T1KYI4_TETUR|nr:calnexin [Tetranychus urticae]